ncbi:MAG: signal transduction histidine kinase, partial [Planctomycetota bacterium]
QTHLFWTVEDLTDDLRMGLLIDASEQQRILARYAIAGLIGVGLATLLATLGGSLFARRIGRELDEVARSVRRVTDSSKSLELHTANAPTEIRQVAESLGVMLENIRSESEQARLITAGLAHELRAPIQNMLGEAEVGLLRERSPAEYQAILGNQLDELRELGLVIDNLVTLTSPGRRSVTRARERFDLGEEARLRLSREEVQARRGGVSLDMETFGELVIEGDREALILAVRNLVGNAIQWSQSGQVVSLSMTDRGNAVVVCVDDQGPGVPEEDRERIFEPFVTTRAAKGQRIGYGLGLALARSAVASHGGKLAVGPSEKGGACFRIELPKKPES